jgi:class 3 adenylate cyclase
MDTMLAFILIGAALAAPPASGPLRLSAGETVPLEGTWQAASPEGATAGQWTEAPLPDLRPRTLPEGERATVYRKTITFTGAPPEQAYGVTMGFGGAAYEVHIDGTSVGGLGRLSSHAAGFDYPREMRSPVYAVPPGSMTDGELVVEVHTEMPARVFDAVLARGEHALGPLNELRARSRASDLDYKLKNVVPFFVAGAAEGVVALLVLGLWWRRRELDAYLWYSLYALSIGCFAIEVAVFRLGFVTNAFFELGVLLLSALSAAACGVQFCHRFLRGPPAGFWRLVWLALLGLIAASLVGFALPWGVPYSWIIPLLGLSFAIPLLISGREALRGNHDARVIVGAFAVATIAIYTLTMLGQKSDLAEYATAGSTLLLLATMGLVLANRYARDLDTLDATRVAALRFVPSEFLGILGRDTILAAQRGDAERIEATVMFSDVRGFTTLSERLSAEQTFALINRYLGVMQPVIHAHGGVVASYLGDGIMAVFPGGADVALRAGIAQIEALRAFNAEDESDDLRVGIGFHRGSLMLGTLGGADHLECTLIGDTVNLAARVEGMSKAYGVQVLCTDAVVAALTEPEALELLELDRVQAKGKTEPVGVFALLDAESDAVRRSHRDTAESFAAALAAFRAGQFEDAQRGFEACALRADDHASHMYVARCEALIARSAPRDWDGVWKLTVK